jgi:hypothetical protein
MGGFILPIMPIGSHLDAELELLGGLLNEVAIVDPIETELELLGSAVITVIIDTDALEVVASLIHSYVITSVNKGNWVKWSDIGSLKFEINERNIAGERPLDWSGQVYALLKLDKFVVAYGSNGVTILNPVENKYGIKTISRIGLKSQGCVCGTDDEHFFIDLQNKMYRLSSEGLQLLDYSEYLSILTSPRMSLDINTGFIYICDGSYGFVYSTQSKSFGSGPTNVSGIGTKNGTLYIASPDNEILVPKFEICTDIYDFGSRNPKTIQTVEVGTDLSENLELMIETRTSNKNNPGTLANDNFMKTPWRLVTPSGIAYAPCYGLEFRFRIRSLIYEYFELDYLKVTGVVHGFNYLNQVQ